MATSIRQAVSRIPKTQTGADQTSSSQVVLQIGPVGVHHIKLLRVKVRRDAGAGATFQPMIFSQASSTAKDFAQEYQGSVTTVATTPLSDDTDISSYCETDALGRLYLQFTSASGVNNQFTYSVWFESVS